MLKFYYSTKLIEANLISFVSFQIDEDSIEDLGDQKR